MHTRSPHTASGFTLFELMLVMVLIALLAGVTAPVLFPTLSLVGHESAARRVAGFGQGVMETAELSNKDLYIIIDLYEQEIWVEHWVIPDDDDNPNNDEDNYEPPSAFESQMTMAGLLSGDIDPDDEKLRKRAKRSRKRYNSIAETRLRARAALIDHEDTGMLSDIDPFGDSRFDLTSKSEKPVREEMLEQSLRRMRLPDNIWISSVNFDDTRETSGNVEIIVSQTGLEREVHLVVENDEGDELFVVWNPLTISGQVFSEDPNA